MILWNASDKISAVVTAEYDRTHGMKTNSAKNHREEEIVWRIL